MITTRSHASYQSLLNYRRSVSDLYAAVRDDSQPPQSRWENWRHSRDALFLTHPQTPLSAEQLEQFSGLDYYEYDPTLRFEAFLDFDVEPEIFPIETDVDGIIKAKRFGRVELPVHGKPIELSIYWLLGYGGGVFLPFRDTTNGVSTYGGGRYLLDTIKHADLGQSAEGKLILDFNFSYNPSCAYNHQWSCPLAPQENRLDVAITAGEKRIGSS